jgi:hypothetical protein
MVDPRRTPFMEIVYLLIKAFPIRLRYDKNIRGCLQKVIFF